jgi:hypothetical protein
MSKLDPSVRERLDLLAARYVLGFLPSDDLPAFAVDLLEAGVDSEAFANLAGGTRLDHPADLRRLVENGLKECAIRAPSRLDAAALLKLHFAKQVAFGELRPAVGSAKIVDLFQTIQFELPQSGRYVGEAFGIARLYGLHDSLSDLRYDDDAGRESIEREILEECRAIARMNDR